MRACHLRLSVSQLQTNKKRVGQTDPPLRPMRTSVLSNRGASLPPPPRPLRGMLEEKFNNHLTASSSTTSNWRLSVRYGYEEKKRIATNIVGTGGISLLHFPGSRLRLMLSVILPCEARTFLTRRPFGMIARDRSAELFIILYH